ncbi:MAG: oxidoreductase [Thaumarchaeota archaeon RBG_16_49_8]|nr:MAG: oxidoreductase [Thaumarchaeota archaeon RBG_16_49_8]
MADYKTSLTGREEVCFATMSFNFEKPEGFQYKAGQHVDITLINPPETDEEGNTRTYTLSSAPFEEKLTITTRMRDTAFKRSLKTVALGTEIELEDPSGSFRLHKDASKPAVFLAGGIGVTPFYSITKQATKDKQPHTIYLFYSDQKPEDAAFLKDLQNLEKENRNFKLIATMTRVKKGPSWQGETGHINIEMLKKHVPDLSTPIYYIAGPPGMVEAMQKMLLDGGIDEDNIRTEEFEGYD